MNKHFFMAIASCLCIWMSCDNPRSSERAMTDNTLTAEDSARVENTPGYTYQNPDKRAGSDGEILAYINAINTNEINAAQEAKRQDISQAARDYAAMLQTEHENNKQQTDQLAASQNISMTESEGVNNLKQKGQYLLTRLQNLDGESFESAYIQAMIEDHQNGLNLIDNQLVPQADNEAVKQHLSQTRQAIEKHLQQAQQLSGNTNAKAQ
jgi:putative membrane protein